MVQKCLDLAQELRCPFFMENPHSGMLKGRQWSQAFPFASWITASTRTIALRTEPGRERRSGQTPIGTHKGHCATTTVATATATST